MKRILILFFILLASPAGASSMATINLDFATVDMLTYRYYLEKKWDSVIVIGKQALRQDIDFYYLRVRMGIAFFEKQEYFPAATHLIKARQFYSEDPIIANYLYYAYLYSNRVEEAGLIESSMTEDERKSAKLKNGVVQDVHIEGGYTFSSNSTPDNLATLMGNDSIYGEQDLYGNSSYSNLGLKLRISKRVSLSLAYNYLNFNKTKYIQYGNFLEHFEGIADSSWGKNYLYSFPTQDTNFNYNINQHEAFLGISLTLPWGLKIMPALHFIHVSYPQTKVTYSLNTVQDTAYYTSFDDSTHFFPFTRTLYSFNQKDTSFNNFVVALRISKDLGRFSIAFSGSWSNLNGKKQKQADISLIYYPLGNLNLYGTTTVTGFFQGKDKRLLISQILGAKITSWMWGEANFYYGNYTNANIFNGSVVYNNSDIIDFRGGATLMFFVGKHIQFSLIYQYFRKESQQYYYIKNQDPGTNEINVIQQTKKNPYNTNTLIGGITWKF